MVHTVDGLLFSHPGVVEYEEHRKTLERMYRLDELPTYDEVWSLVEDVERRAYQHRVRQEKSRFLNFRGVCAWLGFHLVPTVEFVDALAEEIKALQVSSPVIEVAAGRGKLAYQLQTKGIDIHPTDRCQFSPHVETLASWQAVRKYNPELVICAWADDIGTVRQPIDYHSVQFLIDIGEGPEGGVGGESSAYLYKPDRPSHNSYPYTQLQPPSQFAAGWTDSYDRTTFRRRDWTKDKWERSRKTGAYLFTK